MAERSRTRETRQRRVVYEAIKHTRSHPTADWIFDKVRELLVTTNAAGETIEYVMVKLPVLGIEMSTYQLIFFIAFLITIPQLALIILLRERVKMTDTKGVQAVYEPAPTVRAATLKEYPQIKDLLDPVFKTLTLETLQTLNAKIAVNGEDSKKVARDYLTEKGFLK